MNYPLIVQGSTGEPVAVAQELLIQHKCLDAETNTGRSNIDGKAGPITIAAALKFQRAKGLVEDGKIGPKTWAMLLGLNANDSIALEWPVPPPFHPISSAQRLKIFGAFDYSPRTPSVSGQDIKILGDWEAQNIESFFIPQLAGIPLYAPMNKERCSGNVRLHRLAGPVFQKFFDKVELQGFLPHVKTYDGAFNARFVRGSKTSLSNHSWGTAMDLNAYANPLGGRPAGYGEDGCLLPLVSIANECGLYWGGHFSRKDGMHFEVAEL